MSPRPPFSRGSERLELLRRLGREIRSLRVERGYDQERFARHAGLDRSYYGAIERGKHNVTYETLLKIAAGLGVSVGEIVRRADHP
jgi:transcriptional regulator with XRE-family HTH domain